MSIDKRVAGLIAMILVGFGFGVFFLMTLRENVNNPPNLKSIRGQITPTQTPTDTPINKSPTWKNYSSNTLDISINYDPQMNVQEHDDGTVSFILAGPPPKEDDPEVFDGIVINIKRGFHESENLLAFVQSERDRMAKDEIVEKSTPIKESRIGMKNGFEYTLTTFVDFRYFYIEKGQNDYVLLTMFVIDTQNQGYNDIVERMVSSLTY